MSFRPLGGPGPAMQKAIISFNDAMQFRGTGADQTAPQVQPKAQARTPTISSRAFLFSVHGCQRQLRLTSKASCAWAPRPGPKGIGRRAVAGPAPAALQRPITDDHRRRSIAWIERDTRRNSNTPLGGISSLSCHRCAALVRQAGLMQKYDRLLRQSLQTGWRIFSLPIAGFVSFKGRDQPPPLNGKPCA